MSLTKQDLENIELIVYRKIRDSEERMLKAMLNFDDHEKRIAKLEKIIRDK